METTQTISQAVQEMIADCLSRDVEECPPAAKFFDDLGGESIDLLDVQFNCEKRFGVKVNIHKLLGDVVSTDESGRITPASLEALRGDYPFFDVATLGPQPRFDDLKRLITVGAIARLVERSINGANL